MCFSPEKDRGLNLAETLFVSREVIDSDTEKEDEIFISFYLDEFVIVLFFK